MSYEKIYLPSGVIRRGAGVVSGAEIIAAAASEVDDLDRLRALRWVLIDLTLATQLDASSEEIRTVGRHNVATAVYAPRLTIAVVAPRDAVYGVVRMWEGRSLASEWQTRVFRTLPEAEAWLRAMEPTFA